MCDTCGCNQPADTVTYRRPGDEHEHERHHHTHEHGHDHHHHHENSCGSVGSRTIEVEQDLLARNAAAAQRNRGWFEAKNITALNLVSSPGSGKTTLLERTIADLSAELSLAVIEGDQQSLNDAERIAAVGVPVLQVNTGHGCHLDAEMIHRASRDLKLADGSLLMIENVGNLVCPALFDLGESAKVVIISVTEGADKPQKYPTMFAAADCCLINKIDLLPYVDFDLEACETHARAVNPALTFVRLSATTGEGLDDWYAWVRRRRDASAEQ